MNNELQHHGIRGMRWGIRRYQNKDGTLTPEGQERRERRAKVGRAVVTGMITMSLTAAALSAAEPAITSTINSGKNFCDEYNNTIIYDKDGSILASYHSDIKEGRSYIDNDGARSIRNL